MISCRHALHVTCRQVRSGAWTEAVLDVTRQTEAVQRPISGVLQHRLQCGRRSPGRFRNGNKIVKDELGKTSLMVSTKDHTTYVTHAWSVDGGDHYFTCRATLEKGFSSESPDPRAAAPAFEKACQAVNVKTTD